MLCPSFHVFFLTCLCSCLLGPPASQGAPLLECRCCHCHTCTTHRPSFLPLHSVSPGVQVLLFPFLYSTLTHHTSTHTPASPLLLLILAVRVLRRTWSVCFMIINTSAINVLLIPLLSHLSSSSCILKFEHAASLRAVVKHVQGGDVFLMWFPSSLRSGFIP